MNREHKIAALNTALKAIAEFTIPVARAQEVAERILAPLQAVMQAEIDEHNAELTAQQEQSNAK